MTHTQGVPTIDVPPMWPAEPPIAPARPIASRLKALWPHVWRIVLLNVLVIASLWGGLWLRDATWNWTMTVRFHGDINNGFNWGKRANRDGYFSIYERIGEPQRGKQYVDYAPLRLGLMSYWVSGLKEQYSDSQLNERLPTIAFHSTLLRFNTLIELAAAAGVFFVARHLARWRYLKAGLSPPNRSADTATPSAAPVMLDYTSASGPAEPLPIGFWPGTWIALLAAILTWFNPLVIFNAHAWPQWDIWPMPFFIFALYCGLRRWWLAAGLLIGFGAALKGQILMVGWVLPLWALLIGDWRGAIKTVIGAVCAIAVIGSPWILSTWNPANTTLRAFDLGDRILNGWALAWLMCCVAAALAAPLFWRRRVYPWLIALAVAVALWSSMWMGAGTRYWLQCSFGVGTWNYPVLYMGPTSNLPSLMANRYGWANNKLDVVAITLPQLTFMSDPTTGVATFTLGGPISIRTFLLTLFILLCLACAVLAAWHHRRRDPRMIIALCLPWLLFYSFPAQIHERYLLFVSACIGMFIVAGPGWFMLGLVMLLLGSITTLHCVVGANGIDPVPWARWNSDPASREFWGFLRTLVEPTHPGIAFALLLLVAICLAGLCSRQPKGLDS